VNGYTNGAYSVILKLAYQIPEFLPMWGKKVRVYYHGISSFCTNCYEIGHPRSECKGKSSSWKDYVDFLVSTGIPSKLFGTWLSSNLSTTRESEKDVPQPRFNTRNDESDSDEEFDFSNIPPKMLKMFKKLQASTPKSMAKKSAQKTVSKSAQKLKKTEKKESTRGRGPYRGRGRGQPPKRGKKLVV
jgi:hypothetical protein